MSPVIHITFFILPDGGPEGNENGFNGSSSSSSGSGR
jgi:hypothetical protein